MLCITFSSCFVWMVPDAYIGWFSCCMIFIFSHSRLNLGLDLFTTICECFYRFFLVWSCQTSNLPKRWSSKPCVTYWCSSCTAARCSRLRFPSPTSWTVRTVTRYVCSNEDKLLLFVYDECKMNIFFSQVKLCLIVMMQSSWCVLSWSGHHAAV